MRDTDCRAGKCVALGELESKSAVKEGTTVNMKMRLVEEIVAAPSSHPRIKNHNRNLKNKDSYWKLVTS